MKPAAELSFLLELLDDTPKWGNQASQASVQFLAASMGKAGLTRDQRMAALRRILANFPDCALTVTPTFLSTKDLIQPVVSTILNWLLIPGSNGDLREDAAVAIMELGQGTVRIGHVEPAGTQLAYEDLFGEEIPW